MNIYLVVEGKCSEPKIYKKWIKFVNPGFEFVDDIDQIDENNVYLVSGGGHPQYFDVIRDGAFDVAENDKFDLFVIAIDSEEMTYEEKKGEITDYIESMKLSINYRIIVQHFCIETWALGNRSIIPRSSTTDQIKTYRRIWDVLTNDPELLPSLPQDSLNRAQFAEKYLRALLKATSPKLGYSKRNPNALLEFDYFDKIRTRYLETNHIRSFNDFLHVFK